MTRPAPARSRSAKRAALDEATVIRRYFTRLGPERRDIVLGVGDDAAVTRLAPGYDLVTATDAIFEGVHFPRGTEPRALGHRCLAVNLSDLAAMGAEPLWATLALSIPAADEAWLRRFSRGLSALANAFGVALIGGDTVGGPLGMAVTVYGRVRAHRFVQRCGARPGDNLYVTGNPGEAVAGRLLLGTTSARTSAKALHRRFLYPQPRVREGMALARLASAMIDISDGLHDDANKLLRASGCGAELDAGAIPLSARLLQFAGLSAARELALSGGDDYELLFAVPPDREPRLRRITARWPCPVTRLGVLSARRGLRWRLAGKPFAFKDRTYHHFA